MEDIILGAKPTIKKYDLNRKPSDEEVLEIINIFYKGGFKTEAQDGKMFTYLDRFYPGITDLMEDLKRSPEEVLEEAKKIKPILL
jgi:hypothetical protein